MFLDLFWRAVNFNSYEFLGIMILCHYVRLVHFTYCAVSKVPLYYNVTSIAMTLRIDPEQ